MRPGRSACGPRPPQISTVPADMPMPAAGGRCKTAAAPVIFRPDVPGRQICMPLHFGFCPPPAPGLVGRRYLLEGASRRKHGVELSILASAELEFRPGVKL